MFINKIFLITGASKGIGLCLSKKVTELGGIVIGIYNHTLINDDKIDKYKCDITNELEIKKLFTYIKDKYKKIDYVINCAALSLDNDLYDKTKEEFMSVLETNLVGTFLIDKYSSQLMKNGVIINVSSTDGVDTFSTYSMDYAASKAGVDNLTKNLALRLPNLKVCAISPNWVDTDTVLNMKEDYLKSELERVNQKELIKKEVVVEKIIDILTNENIKSGSIVRVDKND